MVDLFLVVFVVFGVFILAMAVGVLFGRKPIKGSCGGLGAITGEDCQFCEKAGKCQKKMKQESAS